jgi:spore germination protein GerM
VAEDGLRLAPVERDVPYADTPSEQAKRIIEAQLMPPPQPLLAAIPNGTTLRGIYVADKGEAYVDFGDTIRSAHPGGSLNELFTVYSIVSVLTVNLPAITSVQILVDSHEVDTLAGHVDLRRPLPRSALWLEPPAIAAAR